MQFWEVAAGFFANLGFGNVVYGVRHAKAGSTPLALRMTPPLLPWREVYLAHGDDRRDPLFSYGGQLPPSFYTGPEFMPDHDYLQAEDKAVIERGAAFGFISGLAFVMPRQEETVVAGWNILTKLKREEALAEFSRFGGVLQMAATLAHREMVHRENIQRKQSKRLSPRQKECLQWLASGLRNEQIAKKNEYPARDSRSAPARSADTAWGADARTGTGHRHIRRADCALKAPFRRKPSTSFCLFLAQS